VKRGIALQDVQMIRFILTALIILGACIPSAAGAAAGPTRFPAPGGGGEAGPVGETVIYSTTDLALAQPIIKAFQTRYPAVAVSYHELQSLDIYDRVTRESDAGDATADLVLSSAMDLQVKLANDGYASRQAPTETASLPRWAVWQDSAFAVTYEPAVIIYHLPSFAGQEPPRTRTALMRLLEERSDLHGKIATYDVERSGLGFLFLARDQEHFPDIWELVSGMGDQGVRLYTNSAAIIDRVATGRFAVGYNILGSYAQAMAATRPDLGIILPEDFPAFDGRAAGHRRRVRPWRRPPCRRS
jgi:iron(III) transport system substrate-binding protein